MEDVRIRIIADSETKTAKLDLTELLEITNNLVKSTDSLRIASEKTSNSQKKETTEQIGLINNLKSSIQALVRLRDEADNTDSIKKYNQQIKEQERELQNLTTAQNKSNVLTKEQNAQISSITGTTQKSNSMFKDLATTLGALFAVDKVIDYSREMFNLVVESDRMNIALKNVSQSNEQYTQSLYFLNKLSNDYGQNVNSLKESYISFLASSNNTNLSVKERQGIYESIIKAGSSLTLSNDAIEGSLRAVSQMFSKGNVSAEELRGQLGERLPGAFGIMAEALGVNEKKLNKMLEQGEVLSEEALPKFAKALEETYGDTAQTNIETVTGASNRFNRSLTENLTRMNENSGFTKALANGINFLADNFNKIVNAISAAATVMGLYYTKQLISYTLSQRQLISMGREVLLNEAVAASLAQKTIQEQIATITTLELSAAEKAAAISTLRFNAALAATGWGALLVAGAAVIAMFMNYADEQERLYGYTLHGIKANDESIRGERVHQEELRLTIERTKGLMEGTQERLSSVKSLMAQYPQHFKNLTAEQVSNWHLEQAYKGVNSEIERKIDLMAKERRDQAITNRLVDLKIKIDESGKIENISRIPFMQAIQAVENNKNLKEYNSLLAQSQQAHNDLGKAQIRQINEELRLNKWKLTNGKITKDQFLSEVDNINEKYDLQLGTHQKEKKLFDDGVSNNKKANDKKLTDFEKYMEKKAEREYKSFEESKKSMDKAVDSYIKSLKKQNEEEIKIKESLMKELKEQTSLQMKYMDNSMMISEIRKATSLQEIADIEKKYSKLSFDRALQDLSDKLSIQKREYAMLKSAGILNKEEELKRSTDIKKTENEILQVKLKSNQDATDDYKKNLENQTKELEGFKEKRIKTEEGIAEEIKQINQAAYTSILVMADILLDQFTNGIDEKINKSTDLVEKARLENQKSWASTGKEALGILDALASGNVVQGVFSVFKTFFSAMNNTMNESTRIWEAEVAKLTQDLKNGWDVLSGSLDSVKGTYGALVDETATLKDLWEDDSIGGRINAEIKIGENINKNFNEATKNEDSLHNQKVANINKELSDSIDAINKKYEHESIKLTQRFDAESLAITEGVNKDLMGFVTNQELKIGLTTEYERRRGQIAEKFALAYVPITEGMTDAEINGINEAIKSRDAAFAQLATWQTSQIQFVIDNGKLERDTFTDTQKIISDGKEAQYQLSLTYKSKDIELSVQKGIELAAAENTKNINIEIETQRHEGVISQLGLDRDAALEASFIRLRDVMTQGYSQMYDAAFQAYLQGKLTAEQFKEAANNLLYLMDLLQKGEVIPKKEDLDKFIEPIVIPRFNTGTELVGGQMGIDRNLAWLSHDEAVIKGDTNRKKLNAGLTNETAIKYAIEYKSILDGGFSPLVLKDSILPKLEERAAMQYLLNMNIQPVVDKLNSVEKAIKSIPIQNFNLNEDGLTKFVKKGNSVQVFNKKRFD